MSITAEYVVDCDDPDALLDYEVRFEFDYTPALPGLLYGPPENCYPPEPEEIDNVTATAVFHRTDYSRTVDYGLPRCHFRYHPRRVLAEVELDVGLAMEMTGTTDADLCEAGESEYNACRERVEDHGTNLTQDIDDVFWN